LFTYPTSWWDKQLFLLEQNVQVLSGFTDLASPHGSRALNLLAKQSTKMHNDTYENCLALDYLLASIKNLA
jgi:hypothetical protein